MTQERKTGLTKKGQAKRDAILAASRQCFERMGYSKTSMDDIARTCGIKKPSLFYYYPTKEILFYESFSRIWEENIAALIETARQKAPVPTRIQDYIRSSVLYYGSVVQQFGTSPSVLLQTEAEFEAIFQPQVEGLILSFYGSVLEEGLETGVFTGLDLDRTVDLIGRVERTFRLDAFKRAAAGGQDEVDFNRLADDTVFVVERLLQNKS